MNKIIVDANTEEEAIQECQEHGWTPDAIREVDSGITGVTSWLCFESASDAELWDKQR